MARDGRASVVLAEDHPVMADELGALLARHFDVLATVGDGCALIEAVRRHAPDGAVVDVAMPRKDGLAAVAQIRGERPDLAVVFVSVHGDAALVARAHALGAVGYVLKHDAADKLVPTLEHALSAR